MTILIQKELFHKEETFREFIKLLEDSLIYHAVIDDFDLVNQRSYKLDGACWYAKDQPIVILHTLTLYRNLAAKINSLYPGTTFNFTDYSFSKLSSLVGREWLFNNDFEIRTIGDLIINNSYPAYENFIRPDSGNKGFTGDVFTRESFSRDFKNKTNDYDKLVIASPPKEIYSEFRFHIYGNQIISQSFYTYKEDWTYEQEDWNKARSFMEKFLSEYDICNLLNIPFVVLDVAVGNPRIGLVEHNCFNTSGIYPDANLTGIIQCLKESLTIL